MSESLSLTQGHWFKHTSASIHPAEVSSSKSLKLDQRASLNNPDINGLPFGQNGKVEEIRTGFSATLGSRPKVWVKFRTLKEEYASLLSCGDKVHICAVNMQLEPAAS